jgi:hypothetical protein
MKHKKKKKKKKRFHGVLIVFGNASTIKLNYLRRSEINWNIIADESQNKRDFF